MDPPQSLSEYISNLNDSVNDYVAMVEEYLEQANITNNNNMIAEAVINAVSYIIVLYIHTVDTSL